MDDVENGIIPKNLQIAFDKNQKAFENYKNFAPGYRKSYLSWLNQCKTRRDQTKKNRRDH